jgi:hypothetical protein
MAIRANAPRNTAPNYHLFAGPVPNSAATVLIGLLTLVFSVDVAGKIVIAIAIFLFFVGAWRVIGSIGAPRGHVFFSP